MGNGHGNDITQGRSERNIIVRRTKGTKTIKWIRVQIRIQFIIYRNDEKKLRWPKHLDTHESGI